MLKKIILVLLFLGALAAASAWFIIFRENTRYPEKRGVKIPQGSKWEDVLSVLEHDSLLKNRESFRLLAEWSGYNERIKAGYYGIFPGMSNLDILRLLASGRQQEVRLVLRSSWEKSDLIAYVSQEISADSMYLVNLLGDSMKLREYGFDPQNILTAMVPNTYNFYWTTGPEKFLERMVTEHKKFWNETRRGKAEKLGLTPIEISILASIVEKETNKVDEMPTIAGVYLNRLKIGKELEADPTVKFAIGNPDIKRVTYIMTEYPSPYNTYYVAGLPPGPICMPSIQAIDAVLNREEHKYLYFCAREDFSGYHNFTHDYEVHKLNSRKYRLELNKRGIR